MLAALLLDLELDLDAESISAVVELANLVRNLMVDFEDVALTVVKICLVCQVDDDGVSGFPAASRGKIEGDSAIVEDKTLPDLIS